MILDSGERREFETGAVRDCAEGKGRFDLVPLKIFGHIYNDRIIMALGECLELYESKKTGYKEETVYLLQIVFRSAVEKMFDGNWIKAIMELAKHFEEGAKKYDDNNWKKGIPVRCYFDSACRHYAKWVDYQDDEPHRRAVLWNIICAIWTIQNHEPDELYWKEFTIEPME